MILFTYFDIGGTIIKDFSGTNKWERFKKDFGITDEFWREYEPKLERGQVVSDPAIISGFVNRFEKNELIWPLVAAAKKSCRVGLLTNMYPGMLEKIKQNGLLPDIDWNVIVDSSVVGVAKPDREIYGIAQEKAGVPAAEILFIDNIQENVDEAKSLGWQAVKYNSVGELKTYFSRIGLV